MSEKLTREQIEDWKSTAFLAAHVMINGEEAVCDFVRLCDLALAALAPAAEPTREPDAWLYTCGKPGLRSTWASIDANDASHWPIDQWTNGYEKRPLYLASPVQPSATREQDVTTSNRLVGEGSGGGSGPAKPGSGFSDPSRDAAQVLAPVVAPQAPSEAVARDAARYRWLNKQHNFLIFIEAEPEMRRENVRLRCGEPLDAWLDKRIEAELPAAPSAGTPEERG